MSFIARSLLTGLLLLIAATHAHAMRCGNRLVNPGDLDIQVRDRCGEPYWSEDRYELLVSGAHSAFENQREVQYTAWYYNFGSNQLLVRLVFRDGQLFREERLGRGVDELGDSCTTVKLYRGISSGELIAYCGEPLSRNDLVDEDVRRYGGGYERRNEVHRERWIYDLGGRFLYVLTLRNGRVYNVETAER